MTGPDLHPDTPDVGALRRRVLLAGVATFALFLAASGLVSALEVSSLWLLLAVAVVYVLVTRPLMQPVYDALRLRRRLAYQAFLDMRAEEQGGGGGRG